jgi:acyl-coenzyme A thioesterase 9
LYFLLNQFFYIIGTTRKIFYFCKEIRCCQLNCYVLFTVDNSEPSDPIALTANFTFVARDSKTGKSAPVNRLVPETEKEKQLFNEREARDKIRKRKREEQKNGLENGFTHFFQGEEAERLRNLLAEGRVFCDLPALADRNSILLQDTRLENALICQPQQRNLYGRIFGGFLMQRAFELGFSTAYAFVGHMPSFLEVDHVDFLKPVSASFYISKPKLH